MSAPLIPYASRTGTKRNLRALRRDGWHLLVSVEGVQRTEGFPYALENGAWHRYQQGKPFVAAEFTSALDRLGPGADWVVVPDIVLGGQASLELSIGWLPRVLSAAPRALVAVQNGMAPADVRPLLGPSVGIFVGGDTRWKEQTIGLWSALGRELRCWVHVGRVNTARRIRICTAEGATSFDGSSPARFAINIPRLTAASRQLGLFHKES